MDGARLNIYSMTGVERFGNIEAACRSEAVVRYRRQVAALLEEPVRRAHHLFLEQSAKLACLFWSADGIDAMGVWADTEVVDSKSNGLEPYILCFVGPMDPLSEAEAWVERTIGSVAEEAVVNLFKPQERYVPTYLMDSETRSEIVARADLRGAEDWLYLMNRRWLNLT